jgi:hypothetical protein
MLALQITGTAANKTVVPAQKLREALEANRGAIRLIHVVIQEPLDLRGLQFDHEVILQHCVFRGHADLRNIRLDKSVDLSGSHFEQNLSLEGAHVGGSLLLNGVHVQRGTPARSTVSLGLLRVRGNLMALGFVAETKTDLACARIGGDVQFGRAHITGGLSLETAGIKGSLTAPRLVVERSAAGQQPGRGDGSLFLAGIDVAGQVNLCGAQVADDVLLYSARVKCGICLGVASPHRHKITAPNLLSSELGGADVQPTHIGGNLSLRGARVVFSVDLNEAQIDGDVDIQDAVIDGDLVCNAAAIGTAAVHDEEGKQTAPARGQVLLAGTRVSGHVGLSGTQIQRDLILVSTEVKGGLYGRPYDRGGGQEPLPAVIHGDLLLGSASLGGTVSFLRARVRGDVQGSAAVVSGLVDFSRAVIGGQVLWENATITGDLLFIAAIVGKWFDKEGHLAVPDEVTATTGDVRLGGARVSGQVSLRGADVRGTLFLQSANIQGGLYCRPWDDYEDGKSLPTTVGRDAQFASLQVAGGAQCEGMHIAGDLWFQTSRVVGGCLLTEARVLGSVNLSDSVIEGDLWCDGLQVGQPAPPPQEEHSTPPPDKEGEKPAPPAPQGGFAQLKGVKVSGQVSLKGTHILGDLNLQSAEINGGIFCRPLAEQPTTIEGEVSLAAATLGVGVFCEGLHVKGDAWLNPTEVRGDVRLTGAVFEHNLHMTGTRIAGALDCAGLQLRPDPAAKLAPAVADLAVLQVAGVASFSGAHIDGDLSLWSTEFNSLFLASPRDVPTAEDPHRRVPTTVTGRLNMAAAEFQGGLQLQGIRILGDWSLADAVVDRDLICDEAVIGSPGEQAPPPSGEKPEQPAGQGHAWLGAVKVSGQASFNGVRVRGDFFLGSAEIKGGLYGRREARIGGGLFLSSAVVAGGVHCPGLRVGKDLSMEMATIDGGLFCPGVEVGGSALLATVRVTGELSLHAAHIQGQRPPDEHTAEPSGLNLKGAEIHGRLDCEDSRVTGPVLLVDARVAGAVDLDRADVAGELSLEGAVIEGTLSCRGVRTTSLSLRSCETRQAALSVQRRTAGADERPVEKTTPRKRKTSDNPWPQVWLEGFEFQQLKLAPEGRAGDDWNEYRSFLEASARTGFDESNFYLIEMWLRSRGNNDLANRVYWQLRLERRRHRRMTVVGRRLDRLLDLPIWLAMHYRTLFFLFFASLLLTILVLGLGTDVATRRERVETLVAGGQPASTDRGPPWTVWTAFWTAVKLHLPGSQFVVADRWELNPRPITLGGVPCWIHYDSFGSLMALWAYIALPLFVGGAAGTWLRQKAAAE